METTEKVTQCLKCLKCGIYVRRWMFQLNHLYICVAGLGHPQQQRKSPGIIVTINVVRHIVNKEASWGILQRAQGLNIIIMSVVILA